MWRRRCARRRRDRRRGQRRQAGAELRPVRRGGARARRCSSASTSVAGGAAAGGDPVGLAGAAVRPDRRLRALRARAAHASACRAWARRALGALGAAYDEMRDALAGRNYVADYVQTLTHELKSPLSAIRGAAELLHEPTMPEADRAALRRQHRARDAAHPGAGRPHDGADRAGVAAARSSAPSRWRCARCSRSVVASAQAAGAPRGIASSCCAGDGSDASVDGDAFLLQRAVGNLLDNALDFSPDGGRIEVDARRCTCRAASRSACATTAPASPTTPTTRCSRSSIRSPGRTASARAPAWAWPSCSEIAELHHGRVTLRNADGRRRGGRAVAATGGCGCPVGPAGTFMASSPHERAPRTAAHLQAGHASGCCIGAALFLGVQALQSHGRARALLVRCGQRRASS